MRQHHPHLQAPMDIHLQGRPVAGPSCASSLSYSSCLFCPSCVSLFSPFSWVHHSVLEPAQLEPAMTMSLTS